MRELINRSDLPKVYGGDLEWSYEDEPALDDDAKAAIGEAPKGPAAFVGGVVTKPISVSQ